jgi:hypothetical protein
MFKFRNFADFSEEQLRTRFPGSEMTREEIILLVMKELTPEERESVASQFEARGLADIAAKIRQIDQR